MSGAIKTKYYGSYIIHIQMVLGNIKFYGDITLQHANHPARHIKEYKSLPNILVFALERATSLTLDEDCKQVSILNYYSLGFIQIKKHAIMDKWL